MCNERARLLTPDLPLGPFAIRAVVLGSLAVSLSERYLGGWPGRFADTAFATLTPRRESFGPLCAMPER